MSIEIDIIPSKSYGHRALICSALAKGRTKVLISEKSEDLLATERCLATLKKNSGVMECGESGSTLRFLLPVAGALGKDAEFVMKGRLGKRPLKPLMVQMTNHGCKPEQKGTGRLTVEGQMKGGQFVVPGNVSSQFVSGLLLSMPLMKEDSRIDILGDLQSGPYVDITLDVMADFGIFWIRQETMQGLKFIVPGGQAYKAPGEYRVEGDWSAAAFWLCMGVIGDEPISVKGLNTGSLQGDRMILDIIKSFGGEYLVEGDIITALPSDLVSADVDVSQMPDLAPCTALLASVAKGTSHITGARRLRMKESDRLKATVEVLSDLGVKAVENKDSMRIKGSAGKPLKGGKTDSHGDHRIAMMAGAASLVSKGKVTLEGKGSVAKSYPGFFEELEKAGLAGNLK